jgi:hypothetical protein
LEEIQPEHYRIAESEPAPRWAVAVAVVDYWAAHFPQQVTVNLGDLTPPGGLADIFLISRARFHLILDEMQQAGIIELFRTAPPYQVARLQPDPEPLLRRMYALDDPA